MFSKMLFYDIYFYLYIKYIWFIVDYHSYFLLKKIHHFIFLMKNKILQFSIPS